jgi:hypothetical protein
MNILGDLWLRFCARLLAWSLERPKRTWPHRIYRSREKIPAISERDFLKDGGDLFVNWTWSRMMEKTEELWPGK